jgi:hypothetical protein
LSYCLQSVDQSYHHWSHLQKNHCPVTIKTMPHSFAFPNDLLSDMIAVWRLDHSFCSSTSTVETVPMAPSEERIEDILPKFSDDSESQKQALNKIHCLSSSISKFVRYKKNRTLVIPLNFVKFGKIQQNSI